MRDLIFSEVSLILIPDTKLAVIRFWEVRESNSAKSIKIAAVIPESIKLLENVKLVVTVAPVATRALTAEMWLVSSEVEDMTPEISKLPTCANKLAASELVVKEEAREPSHKPLLTKSEYVPIIWIEALAPPLFKTVVPSWILQLDCMFAVSSLLKVVGSRTRVPLSLTTTSVKDAIWPSVKAFRPKERFSAVSERVTFPL